MAVSAGEIWRLGVGAGEGGRDAERAHQHEVSRWGRSKRSGYVQNGDCYSTDEKPQWCDGVNCSTEIAMVVGGWAEMTAAMRLKFIVK